jgi:hypothetical protein
MKDSNVKNIETIWFYSDKLTTPYRAISLVVDKCTKFPIKSVRQIFMISIYVFLQLLFRFLKIINQLYLDVYLIQGKEKNSLEKIQLLFISDEEFDSYIEDVIFDSKPKIVKIRKISILKIKNEINKFNSTVDLILVKTDTCYSGYFKKIGFLIIPDYISMKLNIKKPLNEIYKNFSKSAKEGIRKSKKNNYILEFSEDLDKLKMFYYKMYLPYMIKKHGGSAVIVNFQIFKLLFYIDYKLMFIKHQGEYVLGWLVSMKKKTFKPKYYGIKEGRENLLKMGLGASSYFLSIKWAKEHGFNFVDYGGTKPFLQDGIFRYKKKWGSNVDTPDKLYFYLMFALKICKKNNCTNSFLRENPFYYLDKEQLQKYDL